MSRRRRTGFYAAVCAAGALVLGGAIYGITLAGAGTSGSNGASAEKRATAASGAGAVGDQVHRLLAASGGTQPKGEAPVAPDHAQTPMLSGPDTASQGAPGQTPATVPACVAEATQRSQAPIASERERFQGTESYLLVLPHPGDSGKVDAYVVGASCTGTTPGTVLFRATYPR
jgi:hypothetical protein